MRKVQKTGVPCFCGTPVLHHSTENYFMIYLSALSFVFQ